MTKIIIRGDVIVNINVGSIEEAEKISSGLKESSILEQITKVAESVGAKVEVLGESDGDLSELGAKIKRLVEGKCDCDGCKLKNRVEAIGKVVAESENDIHHFDNLFDCLGAFDFINRSMESEELLEVATPYVDEMEDQKRLSLLTTEYGDLMVYPEEDWKGKKPDAPVDPIH